MKSCDMLTCGTCFINITFYLFYVSNQLCTQVRKDKLFCSHTYPSFLTGYLRTEMVLWFRGSLNDTGITREIPRFNYFKEKINFGKLPRSNGSYFRLKTTCRVLTNGWRKEKNTK